MQNMGTSKQKRGVCMDIVRELDIQEAINDYLETISADC